MDRLKGVYAPLVGWDLVAPMVPVRTYGRRPRPTKGHAAIFGNPNVASAESGKAFIEVTVDALEELINNIQPSYEERNSGERK